MGKRYTEKQIQDRIQESRPFISIKPGTYINNTTKCMFIDEKYGEWEALPDSVLRGGGHPDGKMDRIVKSLRMPIEVLKLKLPPFITIDENTYVSCAKKCTFIDEVYGKWEATPDNVLRGRQHPKRARDAASSKLKMGLEDVKQKLPSHIKLKEETYIDTHTKCVFIDEKYGEWEALPFNVFRGSGHPNRTNTGTSKGQLELTEFVKTLTSNVEERYRTTAGELDIYIPGKAIGIEFDGIYYHSSEFKAPRYHIEKRLKTLELGIETLFFREDEWRDKRLIVESVIRAKVGGLNVKVMARKTKIKQVDNKNAQEFLNYNHLMGEYRSAKYIGLYYNDELVSLLGYKLHKGGVDISRFCSKQNTSVIGGLSKLMSEVERLNPNAKFIQSWVDRRYGNGESLLSVGFLEKQTTLGWQWTDFVNTYNRLYCRANMDERRLTEKQYSEELGLVKIYDAGQTLFRKELLCFSL